MARTGFYDDNRNRRYPFISTPEIEQQDGSSLSQIADSLVLDCAFTLMTPAGYDAREHHVWLASVTNTGGNWRFRFSCDAPGITTPLDFVFSETSAEFQTKFSDAGSPLQWHGFLVVGDLSQAVSDVLDAEQHLIEPALIRDLTSTYVSTVNFANRKRMQVTDEPGSDRPFLVAATGQVGRLQFVEGYNCRISYDVRRNGLVIGAGVGAGAGQPCQEVPQTPGELPPDDGTLLSGGPACTELLRAINGLEGPVIPVRGGPGIVVGRDPESNSTLRVTLDTAQLAECGDGPGV